MNFIDIIQKKAKKHKLKKHEIDYVVKNIIEGNAPDYLISAWLMTFYINNCSLDESYFLTLAMWKYSKKINLMKLRTKQPIIDKHSTGGVGDKVTLILLPIITSLGISVAKLSGKGLGFTGGTIDKLQSVGCKTELSQKQMIALLRQINIFVANQTEDIVPADKILYNLRDLTGTVDNYGLIASSILAKKFAILGTHVYLDVKYGSGAFCQTYQQAKQLVKYLKYIAKKMQRKLSIIISPMQQPLGRAIGNLIEIKEAIDFLSGNTNNYPDIEQLIYKFATKILMETKKMSSSEAKSKIDFVIKTKKALNKFYLWIKQQKGSDLTKNKLPFNPKYKLLIKANKTGYLKFKSTAVIGNICKDLGGGRLKKGDKIDFQAGIYLMKKLGDYVKKGETIATLYSSKLINNELKNNFLNNIIFSNNNL